MSSTSTKASAQALESFSEELGRPFTGSALKVSYRISPSNEYLGLISFRIDWFDLPVVQGTLRSLSNTMVQKHQFFGTQPSLWSNSHISTWLLEKSQLWYLDLSRQNDVSSFSCAVYVSHSFSSKEQASFNFRAVVTILSDFGAQENNFFPIYLPWSPIWMQSSKE